MFKIQISNPKIIDTKVEDEISLEESIELIFPIDTEYLMINWNGVFVPLSYKYDISIMVLDFIRIVDFTEDDNKVSLEIQWPSNTFAAVWELIKVQGNITIKTNWSRVIGDTENLLNKVNENTITKEHFKEEVTKLLTFLKTALQKSGIDCELITEFDKLR